MALEPLDPRKFTDHEPPLQGNEKMRWISLIAHLNDTRNTIHSVLQEVESLKTQIEMFAHDVDRLRQELRQVREPEEG